MTDPVSPQRRRGRNEWAVGSVQKTSEQWAVGSRCSRPCLPTAHCPLDWGEGMAERVEFST